MQRIGQMEIGPLGERELLATRTFSAPRPLVWRALTEPALIKQWLGVFMDWTMPVCEVDLRVGGRFRYGWRSSKGESMGMSGTFLEVDTPKRLVATELFDDAWYEGEATDTYELSEQKGKTTLRLVVSYVSGEARDGVLAGPAAGGMAAGYDALDALVIKLHAQEGR
jgi:uncharacterized protein YndB with AHSA1/START domain